MKRNTFENALIEPKREVGAPIPLFDRLVDEDPEADSEVPPKRFYNKFMLIQSIQREIERILSTRTTAKKEQYEELSEDPLNYGLPEMFGLADFSHFDGANSGDWDYVSQLCQRAIEIFEPRVKNVDVIIQSFDRPRQSLSITVQADIALPEYQGEVSFPMMLSTS